ncbi:hypothetical protein OSSY52_14630 [Tepiditoga spiralis]|uniref:Nucleoside phosphorylase domain-containing protein n=1 Tax=Tepiditoga spiralis TaxID=2108365 RepID=A0A7G1GAS0_9BACT|nr:nucleoside phosphorylase [Tepiditoga spiralis]BBE31322.1 hypothetical protein OSSY52_14630 [Tepiditoga spiralis]
MVYIVIAMYSEALPIIKNFNLKKENNVYIGENIRLIITGIGKINSAIETTKLLMKYKPKENDIIINLGTCGTKLKKYKDGDIFLCNKILDHDSKKIYYLDMLLSTEFKEGSIETFSKVVTEKNEVKENLVDMESSGFYKAAINFFEQHKIFLLKIVSDHLTDDISKEEIIDFIEMNIEKIKNFIDKVKNIEIKEIFTKEEKIYIEKICEDLNFSVTQKRKIINTFKYSKLKNGKIFKLPNLIDIPKNKVERKKIFEKLEQELLK